MTKHDASLLETCMGPIVAPSIEMCIVGSSNGDVYGGVRP